METNRRLEKKLSELMPLNHFLATGFSRNSLFLLIKAYGWGKGDEMIVPAFTCPVIPKTIELSGMVPVPVDSEADGLNIDSDQFVSSITENTRAVYVVHTYGTPANIDRIVAVARGKGLIVIEDLAHALFSSYNGKQLGTFGDFAILSFTKKIINFEGGAIGTDNTYIYRKMSALAEKYNAPAKVSQADLVDKYVRSLGAWWESTFSLPALLLMKFNDFLNELIYKGEYGIRVDDSKFISDPLSSKITLSQLDMMKAGKKTANFSRYKEKFKNYLVIIDVDGEGDNTLPDYYTGIPLKKRGFFKLLSFRTWHNINPIGKYPRADYLYANYRIFTKIIMWFK
ncbi:MAG: DegT/DnrJ/EryC1/StrS family aminotransferase [Thermodesulfobacteriota bacterium]|nr:DegT/DnrJ/EryC1/StrS family aminotransferase [Thermodesulfobacteriota bacterium]